MDKNDNKDQLKVLEIDAKMIEDTKEIITLINNKLLEKNCPLLSNIYVIIQELFDFGYKHDQAICIINEEAYSPNIHDQNLFWKLYDVNNDLNSLVDDEYSNYVTFDYDFFPIVNLGDRFAPINTIDCDGKAKPTIAAKDKFTVIISLNILSHRKLENLKILGDSFCSAEYEVIYIWGNHQKEYERFAEEYNMIRDLNCRLLAYNNEHSGVIYGIIGINQERAVLINKNEQMIYNSSLYRMDEIDDARELKEIAKKHEYSFTGETYSNSEYKTIKLDNHLDFRRIKENDRLEYKSAQVFKVNENLDFDLVFKYQ